MSGNESPPKRELPWTDVEVAKLRRTFPTLSASALGRQQSFKMVLARGRASKDGELEETTLPRLEVWEESNLGKSTLSEVRNNGRCSDSSQPGH